MKTLSLMFAALMMAGTCAFAQTRTVQPDPQFHFNFQVKYTGSKTHPELAAFIYKSLRALPGVGIVDKDPDAVLIITEYVNPSQYACSFVILTPQTPWLRLQLQTVSESYHSEQELKASFGEPTDSDSRVKTHANSLLETYTNRLPEMYAYEGSLACANPSAKTALTLAFKSLEVGFMEKQRRAYDYSLTHPVVLPPINPPPPIADPTPQPWTVAPSSTPVQFLGPDPFPSKR